VNPPLRGRRDREALVQGLRDGVIDAVATDHAPHPRDQKTGDLAAAAPGIAGLETALATCLTLGGMSGDWIPVLLERLTAGPHRVLGEAAPARLPRLRVGETATCVLFDPAAEWVVGEVTGQSLSTNTPLHGVRLRGRVLLTLSDGRIAHHDEHNLPWPAHLVGSAGG
jgi:dihydroorotase